MNKNIPSLFERYKDYFAVGAAVNKHTVRSHKDLIKKHFSSITAENEMKPISIYPEKGEYTFDKAKPIKEFAVSNNKIMRGHTLVWHNQTPEHIFLDNNGEQLSADVLFNRLSQYIDAVFKYFGNSVYCWDVVNEAVEDKGNKMFRETRWLKILGENYIDEAFLLAKELNPDTLLFYNDYDAVKPEKRDKIYDLLKGMKGRDIPLDGLGIQGHWNLYEYKYDDIKKAIEKYASLDLEIHITELDVSMFRRKDKRTDIKKPTQDMVEKQNEFYEKVFSIFREYKDVITNVTLWGVADDFTWLDKFPENRKNWPLLFDEVHQPKEAFWKVVDF